jgi:hypothetical protein
MRNTLEIKGYFAITCDYGKSNGSGLKKNVDYGALNSGFSLF